MDEAGIETTYRPEALLGQVEGIPVILASVECSATSVVLRLYCSANEVTRKLDAQYEAEFAAWTQEFLTARKRGGRGMDPPNQPGAFLNDLPLVITDDLGTDYIHPSKQAAGTGTEWEGMWTYKRGIPVDAKWLTVGIDMDGCRERAHAIPL
jgi:hypothetical protein